MSETTSGKLRRHCSLLIYVFSPTRIKDVFVDMATTYETPKIMTINSYPIALTCRVVQLLILTYAFGYIIWYKRGYQDHDVSLLSSVTLKVRGVGSYGDNSTILLDNADYVTPAQENNALFIMTNFIETDQEQTHCAEGLDNIVATCTRDSECEAKRRKFVKSNGRWTGKCNSEKHLCEMEGWCPVENDTFIPEPMLDALNYTLLVKNFIEFTRFNISRRNFLDASDYFRTCRYHSVRARFCPIIQIGELLKIVEPNGTERNLMLKLGAVVRIKIDWLCNLDLGEEKCRPSYSFRRLDSKTYEERFSVGFNFRYASHWKLNNRSHRLLKKAYGLRLIVTVGGDAGRFSLLVLTLNIGSIIGVLGLATFICDIVALYFSEQGYIYRRQKFQPVQLPRPSVNPSIHAQLSAHKRKMTGIITRPERLNSQQSEGIE